MIQPALPFAWPADEEDASFLITPSNIRAVRHIESIATWPVAAALLVGPRKSGRSLLGRVFARRSGGLLMDDADRREERLLFNAWNEAQTTGRPVLFIAEVAPPAWRIELPDLASRMNATPVAAIGEPDDALIGDLLQHLLARRGLDVSSETLAYLIARAPRSHRGVIALADALDTASLATRRPITIPLSRAVLGSGTIDDPGEAG